MAVRRTGKGKFQIQWYDAHGAFRKRTIHGTADDAARLERQLLRERDLGEPYLDPRRAPTFRQAAAAWMEAGRPRWKHTTIAAWESLLSRHLLPQWGDRRLPGLTESDGHALVAFLKGEQRLGPNRLGLTLRVAKTIMYYAVRQRWLAHSPLTAVRGTTKTRTAVDPLSREDFDLFLAAVPEHWKPWFLVAVCTGLRPGEQAALLETDVEWETRSLRVHAAISAGRYGTPKTPGSNRDVGLLPPALEAMRTQIELCRPLRGRTDRPYLFLTPHGKRVMPEELRDTVWAHGLRVAGLHYRPLYHLRHTFASLALASGESPGWVAKQLGHASLQQVFNVYGRFIPDARGKDGAALMRHLGGYS